MSYNVYLDDSVSSEMRGIYLVSISEIDRDYRSWCKDYNYITNNKNSKYFEDNYEEWSGYSYYKDSEELKFEDESLQDCTMWSRPNLIGNNSHVLHHLSKLFGRKMNVEYSNYGYDMIFEDGGRMYVRFPNEEQVDINGDVKNISELTGFGMFDILKPLLEESLMIEVDINRDTGQVFARKVL